MKTMINMLPWATTGVPKASAQWTADFNTNLAIETDSAYGFNVVVGENQYRGSMKVLAEESANTAGTRRLLLKVELPLLGVEAAPNDAKCCSGTTDQGEIPTVSVHTVITVPKSVAASLVRGETAAFQHLSVAMRLLQSLVGGVCHAPVNLENPEDGQIAVDGAIVKVDQNNGGGATVSAPIYYNVRADRFELIDEIPTNAPIWGLLGGLRSVS